MDGNKDNSATSIAFDSTTCPSSRSVVSGQSMEAVEQQLKVLGIEGWRGLDLNHLTKRLRSHENLALNAYLYWLHQNLIQWNITRSGSDKYRSKITFLIKRLRSHVDSLDYQTTYDIFKTWMSVQKDLDPNMYDKYNILDEKIIGPYVAKQKEVLSNRNATMNSRRAKQNRGGVRKQLVIEISSGEDSDVEFMGYGSPSHGKEFDEAHDNKPGDAATKENINLLEPTRTAQLSPMARDSDSKKISNTKSGAWQYVCKRCHKPGHHLTECPTNLDPSYDTKPGHRYKCAICGAVEEHYGTLCPKNTAPWSLNQLRLRSIGRLKDELREDDRQQVSRDSVPTMTRVTKGKRPRETAVYDEHPDGHGLDATLGDIDYIHKSRRALVDHDTLGGLDHIHESRRGLVKNASSRQYLPEDSRRTTHSGEGWTGSPPPKRTRREKPETKNREEMDYDRDNGDYHEERRDKRRLDRRARFSSPEELRSSDGHRSCSSELISVARQDKGTDGRLSYWDNEYGSPGRGSESRAAGYTWFDGLCQNSDIEWLIPGRDPVWEHEMATFDVDEFLEGLIEHLVAYEQVTSGQITDASAAKGAAEAQGGSNNKTARTHGPCIVTTGSRDAKHDGGMTLSGSESGLNPWLRDSFDEDLASPDEVKVVSPAVKAAVQAARVVPLFTSERDD